MGVKTSSASAVTYFEQDGKVNLRDVLRLVHRARCKRADLKKLTVVFMTGFGEGPIFATRLFKDDRPKMIAVTFPPVTRTKDGTIQRMSDEAEAYLRAMKVDIISARLPLQGVPETAGDRELSNIKTVLSHFGRSMPLCAQAVLQSCDAGLIQEGESVISITGDIAAVITACTTSKFLTADSEFCVREFICKPRQKNPGFPESGKFQMPKPTASGKVIDGVAEPTKRIIAAPIDLL